MGIPTEKDRKDKPHVILYCRFTKLIICHLGRIHNIHQRSTSLFHLTKEDFRIGNLKFVPKGEIDEVFGMPIPNELISNNIRNAPYYNVYLKMVTKHDKKVTAKKEGKKKTASTAKPPKSKPAKEKSTKTTPLQQVGKGKVAKVRNVKSPLQLVDGPDEEPAQSEPELEHQGGVAIREPTAEATRPLHVVEGVASEKTNSGGDTEILQITEELKEDVDKQVFMNEDQAGPDPRESRMALAGPHPEPTYAEFMVDLYPKVQESLKFPADEHVIIEDPISSTGSLSLMKNLEDAYTIEDQFIDDKSTEHELEKTNVESEVVSMVTIPIYQASSSIPPMSTPVPVIDLLPPKLASSTTQAPIFTATTITTTTLPLPPPLPQQSTSYSELVAHVITLEQKLTVFEKKSKTLDNTTQNLGSRVFTLELRDLSHKINQSILHQWMFESGSYKSLPEHVALYEALEAFMERANRDEFLAKKEKSRKRRRDDQDPPPPPPSPESDPSKKRRHNSGASGSTQPSAPQSSQWKTSDTRETPSNSSKQQSAPYSEQPINDEPITENVNVTDSEDTNTAHLPKLNTKLDEACSRGR
uniref:Histone deacetylase 14 n=1 Tax=Tanacetum cinerariifolium TaxID=118510 RepID=A0A6L2N6D6_TANCI|nr:hypothetical protein [Tanacetum cinerariifolium]